VLAFACPAAAWLGPEEKRGDLDGDGVPETVKALRVDLKGVADRFDQTKVVVEDTCHGALRQRRIAGPQDNLALLRLKQVDPLPGRQVFVDLRSGAKAVLGEARLVAWRRKGTDACGGPHSLFAYKTDHHTRTPRGGSGDIASFDVRLRELKRAYRGPEIKLEERFYRRGEPAVSPGSIRKLTYWRYSAHFDRYIKYFTRLQYLRPFNR
jgi:hypothetical protein